jgi:hypothetical protein
VTLPCPRCGCALRRIRRRWIDRVISRFVLVWRYACLTPGCYWVGNRKVKVNQDAVEDS